MIVAEVNGMTFRQKQKKFEEQALPLAGRRVRGEQVDALELQELTLVIGPDAWRQALAIMREQDALEKHQVEARKVEAAAEEPRARNASALRDVIDHVAELKGELADAERAAADIRLEADQINLRVSQAKAIADSTARRLESLHSGVWHILQYTHMSPLAELEAEPQQPVKPQPVAPAAGPGAPHVNGFVVQNITGLSPAEQLALHFSGHDLQGRSMRAAAEAELAGERTA
jgi:hypothetical protein